MRVVCTFKRGVTILALAMAAVNAYAEIDVLDAVQGLVQAGRPEQALSMIEGALSKDPANFQLRYLKAIGLIDLEKYEEAVLLFDTLIREIPQVAELYNNRGFAHVKLKRYSAAMQDFEEAIRLKPNYSLAHENLGLLYVAMAELALGDASSLDKENEGLRAKHAAIQAATTGQLSQKTEAAAADPVSTQPPVGGDKLVIGPAPTGDGRPAASASADAAAIGQAIDIWRKAWMEKDMPSYFVAYASEYKAGAKTADDWRIERERRIAGKSDAINLKLAKITISIRTDGTAKASFLQTYRAGKLLQKDRKSLVFKQEDGRWVIVQEKAIPVLPVVAASTGVTKGVESKELTKSE